MPGADHTFIIPAYKESAFLEACILSLKKQTCPGEILIITSTPSPFLDQIAFKHGLEIRVNERGGGIAGDWNFAYKSCRTKYLTLAHQDDIYLPEYTEQCLRYAEKPHNRDLLILFTDYRAVDGDRPRNRSFLLFVKKMMLLPFLMKNHIGNKFLKRSILSFGNPVSCPTVMFNRENSGTFEFNEEFRYNLDWDAWLRLAGREGRFVYVNRKLVLHRLHSDSQTAIQTGNANRHREEEQIFRRLWNKPGAKLLMGLYRYGSKLSATKPVKNTDHRA